MAPSEMSDPSNPGEQPSITENILSHSSAQPPQSDARKQGIKGDDPPRARNTSRSPSIERTSSQSSTKSESSTILYGQTPFDVFRLDVQDLCQSLWPSPSKGVELGHLRGGTSGRLIGILRGTKLRRPSPSPISHDLPIERLDGGTFNRITGVVIRSPEGDPPLRLILRTPRVEWDSRPDRDVAILRYIRKYTSIPVAEVKAVDFTNNNPLKQPYVFQTRIPGYNLQRVYPNLSHEHNCTVAREIAKTLLALQSVNSRVPGLIEAAPDSGDNFIVQPFDIKLRSDRAWKSQSQDHEKWTQAQREKLYGTTIDFLTTQFGRWRADELQRDPSSIASWHYQHRFVEVAQAMNRLGIFNDSENCLCHLDLAARNIMVDVPMDGPLTISGILDWDSAIFAPNFVCCTPPWWVWADDSEDDGADWDEQDETRALAVPPTVLGQELKRIFEETVGEQYLRFAYEPQYRMARELFHFAVNGLHQNEDIARADKLFEEWKGFYDKLMDQAMEEMFEGSEESDSDDNAKESGDLPRIDTPGEGVSFEQEMAKVI